MEYITPVMAVYTEADFTEFEVAAGDKTIVTVTVTTSTTTKIISTDD